MSQNDNWQRWLRISNDHHLRDIYEDGGIKINGEVLCMWFFNKWSGLEDTNIDEVEEVCRGKFGNRKVKIKRECGWKSSF